MFAILNYRYAYNPKGLMSSRSLLKFSSITENHREITESHREDTPKNLLL